MIYLALAVVAMVVIFAVSVAATDLDADRILAVLTWEPQTSREISIAAFGENHPAAKTYVALGTLVEEGWAEYCPSDRPRWRRKRMGKRKWSRGQTQQPLGALVQKHIRWRHFQF